MAVDHDQHCGAGQATHAGYGLAAAAKFLVAADWRRIEARHRRHRREQVRGVGRAGSFDLSSGDRLHRRADRRPAANQRPGDHHFLQLVAGISAGADARVLRRGNDGRGG